jgi:UDP-GlcNAc:undecaprenyl-phosphate GlcNAc-1-phosphate transferase
MSILLGLAAFIFSLATIWGSIFVILTLLVGIEIIVEKVGLVREDYKPLLNFFKGFRAVNIRNR